MRITIVGGNGYVGSQLTSLLLLKQHEVTVLDKYTRPSPLIYPDRYIDKPSPILDITGDINVISDTKMAIRDADIIVNLAAVVGTPTCDEFPKLAYDTNVIGAMVLNQCRRDDQPIIFASTGNVYGAVSDILCTENTAINPLTHYAKTKSEAENYVLPNGIVLRFTTGFGVSPKMRYDALINNWVDIISKQHKLDVYQPEAIRSFIDVYDMASTIIFMIEHMNEYRGEIFNVGNDDINLQKKEIAATIGSFLPCDVTFTSGPTDKDARDYANSFAKLTQAGFRPTVSLDQGIQRLVKKMAQGRKI